jgi:hypothetical protein
MNDLQPTISRIVSRRNVSMVRDAPGVAEEVLAIHPQANNRLVLHLVTLAIISRTQAAP